MQTCGYKCPLNQLNFKPICVRRTPKHVQQFNESSHAQNHSCKNPEMSSPCFLAFNHEAHLQSKKHWKNYETNRNTSPTFLPSYRVHGKCGQQSSHCIIWITLSGKLAFKPSLIFRCNKFDCSVINFNMEAFHNYSWSYLSPPTM